MMAVVETGPLPLAAGIDEAREFARLGAGIDDVMLAAMVRSATSICEQFIGQALVSRSMTETVNIRVGEWLRLARSPVSAISAVVGVPAEGAAFALPVGHYAIDIDAGGDGWVRVSEPGIAGRMRVTYQAGMVASAGLVPDALRQGVVMLSAHLLRERDRDVPSEPPAAVAALWRPWRRIRLS
jgi:uncharacterized phiE125 gp8 family phage protein